MNPLFRFIEEGLKMFREKNLIGILLVCFIGSYAFYGWYQGVDKMKLYFGVFCVLFAIWRFVIVRLWHDSICNRVEKIWSKEQEQRSGNIFLTMDTLIEIHWIRHIEKFFYPDVLRDLVSNGVCVKQEQRYYLKGHNTEDRVF